MVALALPRGEDTNWEGGYRLPTAVPRPKLSVAISRRLGVIKKTRPSSTRSSRGTHARAIIATTDMPDPEKQLLKRPESRHQDLVPPVREACVVARGPQPLQP